MKIVNSIAIKEAYERIKQHIVSTPMITSEEINKKYGAKVFFKLENEQRTGSFKIRGALNKILQLTEKEKEKGIVAYSSGNHGQAVSYVSKLVGVDSTIVMPSDAPSIKLLNTRKYGSKIVLYNRLTESREQIASDIVKEKGGTLIRPFDDEDVIIGQGTAGLEITNELLEKKIQPDIFLCCCSGGGLIAGISTYLKTYFSNLSAYCVEPQYYDDMRLSLEKGELVSIKPDKTTICDALTVAVAGNLTFSINKKILKGGLVVTDNEVKNAIRFLKNKLKIVSEPGGAAPTAAFLSRYINFQNKVVIVMVSGGNIDKDLFKRIMNNE